MNFKPKYNQYGYDSGSTGYCSEHGAAWTHHQCCCSPCSLTLKKNGVSHPCPPHVTPARPLMPAAPHFLDLYKDPLMPLPNTGPWAVHSQPFMGPVFIIFAPNPSLPYFFMAWRMNPKSLSLMLRTLCALTPNDHFCSLSFPPTQNLPSFSDLCDKPGI